jgi:hypothetical protein
VKRTGSKKTLTTANLAALGAERLADLLIDVAEGHAQIKRRLRLELSAAIGADDLVSELNKRLEAVSDSRARIHWRKHKEFLRELDMLRALIAGQLATLDPTPALPMMLGFVALAEGVSHRTADAKGEIEAVFDAAVDDVAAIAPLALPDPRALGDQLLDLLLHGRAGLGPRALKNALPALGAEGVALLRARVETTMASQKRVSGALKAAVQVLADAQGDVDGYIAQFTDSQAVLPPIGAQIARRLAAAGRLDEAVAALDRSTPGSFAQLVGTVLGRPSLPGPGPWTGRTPISRCWRRAGRATWPRRCAGQASSAACRSSGCAITSSACPISTTSRPRTGPWPTPRTSTTSTRPWIS